QLQTRSQGMVHSPPVQTTTWAAVGPRGPNAAFSQRDCSDNRSCTCQTQVKLPAPRTKVQNLRLAPTISTRKPVHFRQNSLRPRTHLIPEERLNVELRLPLFTAPWTRQLDLQISLRINFSHPL